MLARTAGALVTIAFLMLGTACSDPYYWTPNYQPPQGGSLRIGMSADEAERRWGTPGDINYTTTAGGTSEQWIYYTWGYYGREPRAYVYIENGEVVAIQN